MRCTQIMGLKQEANEFIEQFCKKIPDLTCPYCSTTITEKKACRIYDTRNENGMFEDGPSLIEYDLIDGRVIREVIQETVWSSGPCIFLCLECNGERYFEWSQECIDNC